jgi:hypothetical protein
MNHIKTMLCGNLIGIDKLERLKLLLFCTQREKRENCENYLKEAI